MLKALPKDEYMVLHEKQPMRIADEDVEIVKDTK